MGSRHLQSVFCQDFFEKLVVPWINVTVLKVYYKLVVPKYFDVYYLSILHSSNWLTNMTFLQTNISM